MTDMKHEPRANSNEYHLGKLIQRGLSSQPDLVCQIDGSTSESETNESVLQRSLRLASALRERGVGVGDTVALVSRHHLDSCIAIYASLFLGAAVQPCDVTLSDEIMEHTLRTSGTKVVFCQNEFAARLSQLQPELGFELITFGDKEGYQTMRQFTKKHLTDKSSDFSIAELDPTETIALLLPTSGTTGIPKLVMITHANIVHQILAMQWIQLPSASTPTITRTAEYIGDVTLVLSPLQWLTGVMMHINSAIGCMTRLQTANALTVDLIHQFIQQYRPTMTAANPGITKTLLEWHQPYDLSCFTLWMITGSTVPKQIFAQAKRAMGKAAVVAYGATEFSCWVFRPSKDPETDGVGSPHNNFEYKLIDVDKGSEIMVAGEIGELWVKSATVAKGYMNEPETTKEVFLEDGWAKSGDLMYRDASGFFHFVERIKLLIKYYSSSHAQNQYMAPAELETVIRQLDGVDDVAVAGVENPAGGELPVAVVVKRPGSHVTAEQVVQKVKENLPEMKQLHGGVVFVGHLPRTSTGKINQREIKTIASTSEMIIFKQPFIEEQFGTICVRPTGSEQDHRVPLTFCDKSIALNTADSNVLEEISVLPLIH